MPRSLRLTLFLCLPGTAGFAQVRLNSGLVAYYPVNGNFDSASGNGNHGIGMNGVGFGTRDQRQVPLL